MASQPITERERLARFYAGLADEELAQLAESADTLTDTAAAALGEEMARRNLAFSRPADFQGGGEPPRPSVRHLVTIRRFRDVPEALLAKSVLESAGIEAFLGDDNLIRMDWLWSNLLGGVKVRVAAEDVEAALAVLGGTSGGLFAVPREEAPEDD